MTQADRELAQQAQAETAARDTGPAGSGGLAGTEDGRLAGDGGLGTDGSGEDRAAGEYYRPSGEGVTSTSERVERDPLAPQPQEAAETSATGVDTEPGGASGALVGTGTAEPGSTAGQAEPGSTAGQAEPGSTAGQAEPGSTAGQAHAAAEAAAAGPSAAGAPGDGEHAQLLASGELQAIMTRWREIQAGFVDEPRQALSDADALVAELMDRLTQMFARERDQLESRWRAGNDVSTEDLRQGLRRYRSFFERLLAI
jgi:hypothetical protein